MARVRTGKPIERQGLSTVWERRVVRTATVLAVVPLIVSVALAVALVRVGISAWAPLSLSALVAYLVYAGMTRKVRRRRAILAQPFPAEWEAILQREVVFFRALTRRPSRSRPQINHPLT